MTGQIRRPVRIPHPAPHYGWLLGGLGAATLVAFLASLLVGPAALDFTDSLASLFSGAGDGDATALIMHEIRLPRALLGLLIGMTLGVTGASLQGFLRNPLAEPGVIGISASAAFGAVLTIYTGFALVFPLALPVMAIVGALAAVVLLQTLTGAGGTLTLVLAGVALSSLAGALTSLVLNLSPNPFAIQEIVFWMLGSLADRSMEHVLLAAPFMLIGCGMLIPIARALDVLSLGEETAQSLGVNLRRTRLLLIAGAAVSIGAATAVSGVIGFVGLVVPHILRPFVGRQPSRLLPASALGGALLILAADVLVRVITPGNELRLGVVTALIGAPFFLALILRMNTAYGE